MLPGLGTCAVMIGLALRLHGLSCFLVSEHVAAMIKLASRSHGLALDKKHTLTPVNCN